MKLQNLTVVFIIIILPIILLVSFYISTGLKTIDYQARYDTALLNATHDAIYAFEINTARDMYSDNAEAKRDILKSSVKMFEKSLCNSCNISVHEANEIDKHIPALVFGVYDGFYMYAPSYVAATNKYEHNLKNYVYYSERFDDGTVITYTLDNYVTVFHSGKEIREGYLIDRSKLTIDGDNITYNGVTINKNKSVAIEYYTKAKEFTDWFLIKIDMPNKAIEGVKASYLSIGEGNDPEDPNSAFVQHKRIVMKEKIESVLNSSITVYSDRTLGHTYKMPKLSEEDWEKVYTNISMISFFQGKEVGFTTYNGYCVLNSTNSNEYVNPNLMYFTHDGYYHDIRCSTLDLEEDQYIEGFKIGDFQMKNEDGTYKHQHPELACYECINGQISGTKSLREYIYDNTTNEEIRASYWTSLAVERYNTTKVTNVVELRGVTEMNIIVKWIDAHGEEQNFNGFRPNKIEVPILKNGESFMTATISEEDNKVDDSTWKISIDELEAYKNNAEVTHDVVVQNITGYEVSSEKEDDTVIITYKDNNEKFTDIKILVNWTDDNNNIKNIRPNEVIVRLNATNADLNRTETITDENVNNNNWSKSIKLRNYKDGIDQRWNPIIEVPSGYEESSDSGYSFTLKCAHNMSEWEITKDETCTENGKQKQICAHCGKKVEETRLALGHNYETDYKIDLAATCTAKGKMSKHCTRCDSKTEEQEIAMIGHSYPEYAEVIQEETCTTEGKYVKTCMNEGCNNKMNITKDALGHSFTSKDTSITYRKSAATCQSEAVYYYKCSRSNCNVKGTTTYKSGGKSSHSYTANGSTVASSATCTQNKKCYKECKWCGEDSTTTYEVANTKLEHSWSHKIFIQASCMYPGEEGDQCDYCGATQNISTIEQLEHDWGYEYHPAGYGNQYCKRCYLNYKGW